MALLRGDLLWWSIMVIVFRIIILCLRKFRQWCACPWLRYLQVITVVANDVFKLLWSSYIIWNTIFVSTNMWLFCPVVRPQGTNIFKLTGLAAFYQSSLVLFPLLFIMTTICDILLFSSVVPSHIFSTSTLYICVHNLAENKLHPMLMLSSTDLCWVFLYMVPLWPTTMHAHGQYYVLIVLRTKSCFTIQECFLNSLSKSSFA